MTSDAEDARRPAPFTPEVTQRNFADMPQCLRHFAGCWVSKLETAVRFGERNPASLFRKGVIGDRKGRVDDAPNDYVIEKVGPLMRRFGRL